MENPMENKTINDVREEALISHFRDHAGQRVFILTEAFPFMFIGKIKRVVDDMAFLHVETTSVPALEGKEWSIHLDSVEVFYIEKENENKIPFLQDNWKRGRP
ncbi:hypothetical protein [Bhargavaea cecembensis]|uniref:hypothetical protein n=1 Tax=Bhargavaea cecembensis TaxID=394098 RepID=UPI00058EB461|nr:hypothetical protein [Bhargavaea cecembensis]